MLKLREYILQEGKEEAAYIRTKLKKELGLTSRDASVKTSRGGTSSSVDVTIKSEKALALKTKIENIGQEKESYQRDYGTGEILAGGNTFVFVNIDYDLRNKLADKVNAEFKKVSGGDLEEGDSVVLFKTFRVSKSNGKIYITMERKSGVGTVHEVPNVKYIGGDLIHFIGYAVKDDSLYAKIK